MSFLSHVVRIVFTGVVLVGSVSSQSATDPRPSFDVAAVKPNNSGTGVDRIKNNGGTLLIENVSLKRLIAMALNIPEFQNYLFSGPDWLDSENFDIQARFPPDTPREKFLQMLQRLL